MAPWEDLDGLIVSFIGHNEKAWADWVVRTRLPYIHCGFAPLSGGVARLKLDFASIIAMAIEHYVARGFRRVGYVAWGAPSAEKTCFEEAARNHKLECVSFLHKNPETADYSPASDWHALEEFLRSVPKPIGLLTVTVTRARQTADRCRLLGIRVPEDVAVLGIEDEPTEIAMAHPPLSCVCLASEQAGYMAAEALDAHLTTGNSHIKEIPLRATRVLARQSTDVYAVADEDVRDAMAYIAENATKRLTPADLLERGSVARRSLERRFRALLGRSILEEIQRVRIEHAKGLLAETDLKVATIAIECGYSEQKRLGIAFRQIVGCTPGEWRKRVHVESGSTAVLK